MSSRSNTAHLGRHGLMCNVGCAR